jgi:hypothetical protein
MGRHETTSSRPRRTGVEKATNPSTRDPRGHSIERILCPLARIRAGGRPGPRAYALPPALGDVKVVRFERPPKSRKQAMSTHPWSPDADRAYGAENFQIIATGNARVGGVSGTTVDACPPGLADGLPPTTAPFPGQAWPR